MKWQPLLIALLFVLSQAALFAGFVGLWRRRPLVITGPGVAMVLVAGSVALLGACGWMVFEVGHSGAAMAGFMMAAAVSLLLVRVVHAAESSCIVIGTTRRWVRHAMRASFFRMSVPFHDESVDDDTSSGRNASDSSNGPVRSSPVPSSIDPGSPIGSTASSEVKFNATKNRSSPSCRS